MRKRTEHLVTFGTWELGTENESGQPVSMSARLDGGVDEMSMKKRGICKC